MGNGNVWVGVRARVNIRIEGEGFAHGFSCRTEEWK